MLENQQTDILIIGGGLVGASMALALAPLGLQITVVEATPTSTQLAADFDARSIALSLGGKRIFSNLQVWQSIAAFATPIKNIHVSDRGHFGFTRLSAKKQQVEALGFVIEMQYLNKALHDACATFNNIHYLSPATLETFENDKQGVQATIRQHDKSIQFAAKLLIAADGGNSFVRKLKNIDTRELDYGQSAIVGNVGLARSHNNVAYERFTDTGPLAMLPLTDDRTAFVWTVNTENVSDIITLNDHDFLQALQKRFGYRLGRLVKAGHRHAFPLKMIQAKKDIGAGFAIIGNAAHNLHPIAGQGFNLGLRDVAVLAQVIKDALNDNKKLSDINTLQAYANWRKQDHRHVIRFTDGMTRLFSNNFIPLKTARNIGLVAADLLPPVKHKLSRRAMGFVGTLPDLAL